MSSTPSRFGAAVGAGAGAGAAPVSGERRSDALRVAAAAPGGLSFIPDASPFFDPPVSAAANAARSAAARSASAALRATAAASRAAAFCSRLVGARGFASRGGLGCFSFGGGGGARGRTRQSSSFRSRRFSVSRPGMHTFSETFEESSSAFSSSFFFSSGSGGAHSSSAKRSVASTRIFSNCASRSSADHGEKPCLSEPRSSAASASVDHHAGSAPRCTTGHAKSSSRFSSGGDEVTVSSPASAEETKTSSAAERAARSFPHLAARCHPLANLL